MTTQSSRRALQLRLWALFMFFFIPGLLMASWATRTPAIRDLLALSTAEMGVVLFGLSVGSMSGILCSAWLVKRFGTRKVIRTTMSFAVLGMLVLSLALWVTSAPLFASVWLSSAPASAPQRSLLTSKARRSSGR
ncbi:major facilitator superfamily protein [Klebsiella pneumoniae]|uniref:Major facilitator superfamily protein n=1 Tax=Klebsiella pneumoniae TaxID=573 RepID=A0A377XP77_KLEPN|nr:major facilitator superfamily protein [Klebsiella pneumoniae]